MQQAGLELEWRDALQLLRADLNDRRGEWKRLADQADVTYRWLRAFANGNYEEPHAGKVIRLSRALGMGVVVTLFGLSERLKAQMAKRRRPGKRVVRSTVTHIITRSA